jgi:ribosomal protein RSM22 (predicted rRNA methylase)
MDMTEFRSRIEEATSRFRPSELSGAFAALAALYDGGRSTPATPTALDAAAYGLGRAPGTHAAMAKVLDEIKRVRPGWAPQTLLDVGAGVGSAASAADDAFGSLRSLTLVERSTEMIALGRQLVDGDWIHGDVEVGDARADLVVAAYVLGELVDDTVVERWFAATHAELVIVEPGTPAGFDRIRRARVRLINLGATITAPCPHEEACPMPSGADWCHFGVRVQRSRAQRAIKSGDRGFEDEKYSYVVASKQGPAERGARVLRRPQKGTGHVRLHLCARDGLRQEVVARREARKVSWGDAFGPSQTA